MPRVSSHTAEALRPPPPLRHDSSSFPRAPTLLPAHRERWKPCSLLTLLLQAALADADLAAAREEARELRQALAAAHKSSVAAVEELMERLETCSGTAEELRHGRGEAGGGRGSSSRAGGREGGEQQGHGREGTGRETQKDGRENVQPSASPPPPPPPPPPQKDANSMKPTQGCVPPTAEPPPEKRVPLAQGEPASSGVIRVPPGGDAASVPAGVDATAEVLAVARAIKVLMVGSGGGGGGEILESVQGAEGAMVLTTEMIW